MNLAGTFTGLNKRQVDESRSQHGWNKIATKHESPLYAYLKNAATDPMLLLLVAAAIIYFLHGELAEGIFLISAIILISSISHCQESRSRNAIESLQNLTQPKSKVIRNSTEQELAIEEIVVGDYMIVEEGESIPADGSIIQSNDFAVNEAVLTGESLPVMKEAASKSNQVYQGTMVVSGLAICEVEHIGINTKIGQIGKRIQELKEEKSPLQIQIEDFVKKMAIAGGLIFVIIWAINFYHTGFILESLLRALTLAMSILPEEIPVAFSTFMALGAWRLMKIGVIVKHTKTVETLGSANVICIDKTGTITKNEMSLTKVYVHAKRKIFDANDYTDVEDVINMAMWASEPIPFDPMEKALHHAYEKTSNLDLRPSHKLIHEYPLQGHPPLMTHIFSNKAGRIIIAAKGAPEALIELSGLQDQEKQAVMDSEQELANEGYRVLGVGEAFAKGSPFPKSQQDFKFNFKGLVAFYDPPKENIKSVLQSFYKAGLQVKIITGDNITTTATIARQINFQGTENFITGEELMPLTEEELARVVMDKSIFTRVFPEAKLKIIQALKGQNQVVAMTGDGVNDGPALKAAHIGIAMGKNGSEVARQASALILADDDLVHMVEALEMGRKIYNNLKKAIQYIMSIHIPIILIVFIPLVAGWIYPAIFTPVHIIFLELIMGPTCSIIYENEPIEKNLMEQKPRQFTTSFFNIRELSLSIIQGLVITAGLLFIYWQAVRTGGNEQTTTSMVFVTLITSNILLTLVNRSFYFSILTTLRYKNKLIPMVIALTILLVIILFSFPGLRTFYKFELLSFFQLLTCVTTGFLTVIWFEGLKFLRRKFDA